MAQAVKTLPAIRSPGSIPEPEDPGEVKWLPTPYSYRSENSINRGSLVGYILWGTKESDMTGATNASIFQSWYKVSNNTFKKYIS